VVVACCASTLKTLISAQFHLLASLANLLYDKVGNLAAVNLKLLNLVERFSLRSDCSVENRLCQGYETFVLCNEVGLALQSYNSAEICSCSRKNATLRSLAVFTLCCHSLTFLTNDLYSGIHIAVGFFQRFLAIHHTSTRKFTEFADV